jgi:hypothetical protein
MLRMYRSAGKQNPPRMELDFSGQDFSDESVHLFDVSLSKDNSIPKTTQDSQNEDLLYPDKVGRARKLSQWAMDRWVFELLASIISAACLAGIVATLALHANHPLPSWPLGITINALVSVLSTISKSALLASVAAAISQQKWARLSNGANPLSDLEMYDNASRGPWGSFLLLFRTGWRYANYSYQK